MFQSSMRILFYIHEASEQDMYTIYFVTQFPGYFYLTYVAYFNIWAGSEWSTQRQLGAHYAPHSQCP